MKRAAGVVEMLKFLKPKVESGFRKRAGNGDGPGLVSPCRECQRLISSEAVTCPHCRIIAPVLQHATTLCGSCHFEVQSDSVRCPQCGVSSSPDLEIRNETPVRLLGHEAQGEPATALPQVRSNHRSTHRFRPRRLAHGRDRRSVLFRRAARWRQHPVLYVIGGLILLIVIVGSLAQQQIGSLAQSIGSLAHQQIDSLAQFIGLHAQQPTDSGVQQPTASGAQQPTASGAQRPTASGAQRPTASGAQRPTGSGMQRPTASGAQQPTASGAQHSKSSGQRPEEKKTAAEAKADARVERDLKETKSACQAAAQARLKAPLTASFVYDDVARVRGKTAYVKGSVDVPNGLSAKLRNRYACELARREQGGWQVTKVVFEGR